MFAVKPGATGDISLQPDQTANAHVSWFQPRLSGYTPSPLFYRGRLYVVNDNGILQVADATTGKEIYKARVGGIGNTFSSSPFASAGRIYLVSEDGDTFVLPGGRRIRGAGEEQPRRDEPCHARRRCDESLHPHADQACTAS